MQYVLPTGKDLSPEMRKSQAATMRAEHEQALQAKSQRVQEQQEEKRRELQRSKSA